MGTFMVGYDLKKPGQDYKDLIAKLEELPRLVAQPGLNLAHRGERFGSHDPGRVAGTGGQQRSLAGDPGDRRRLGFVGLQ